MLQKISEPQNTSSNRLSIVTITNAPEFTNLQTDMCLLPTNYQPVSSGGTCCSLWAHMFCGKFIPTYLHTYVHILHTYFTFSLICSISVVSQLFISLAICVKFSVLSCPLSVCSALNGFLCHSQLQMQNCRVLIPYSTHM